MVERLVTNARAGAEARDLGPYVDPAIESVRANSAGLLQNAAGTVGRLTARLFGGLGHLVGLSVLPLLAYYLLAEREAVRDSVMRFLPRSSHDGFHTAGVTVDRALRSYIRGQFIVCLVVGTATGLGLFVAGVPLSLLLGVVVGVAEVVPFVGFLVAAVLIALVGAATSPLHAGLGVAIYAIVNNVVGIAVTPRVMGRQLKMHPFVVTVSILAGIQLLGPGGVILALPTAAAIQSMIRVSGVARARAAAATEAEAST